MECFGLSQWLAHKLRQNITGTIGKPRCSAATFQLSSQIFSPAISH